MGNEHIKDWGQVPSQTTITPYGQDQVRIDVVLHLLQHHLYERELAKLIWQFIDETCLVCVHSQVLIYADMELWTGDQLYLAIYNSYPFDKQIVDRCSMNNPPSHHSWVDVYDLKNSKKTLWNCLTDEMQQYFYLYAAATSHNQKKPVLFHVNQCR